MSAQPQIPNMQYAQIFQENNGNIEYKQVPIAEPGPDEVLVNVKFTGVCHTDLHVCFSPLLFLLCHGGEIR